MPSDSGSVGLLSLPLPAADAATEWTDPLVDGLLSYLGHWLKADLDARLGTIPNLPDDACPVANRFGYEPGRTFVREAMPALFVWRNADEQQIVQYSQLQDELRSVVRCFYIIGEFNKPDDSATASGLFAAVNACLARATRAERHSTWSYGSYSAGTPVFRALGIEGWQYQGGKLLEGLPEPGERPVTATRNTGGDSAEQRYYPIVTASWLVREFITPGTATELNNGADVAIQHDVFPVMDRIVPSPNPEYPE